MEKSIKLLVSKRLDLYIDTQTFVLWGQVFYTRSDFQVC